MCGPEREVEGPFRLLRIPFSHGTDVAGRLRELDGRSRYILGFFVSKIFRRSFKSLILANGIEIGVRSMLPPAVDEGEERVRFGTVVIRPLWCTERCRGGGVLDRIYVLDIMHSPSPGP